MKILGEIIRVLVGIMKGPAIVGLGLVIFAFIMTTWSNNTRKEAGEKQCQESLQMLERLRSYGVLDAQEVPDLHFYMLQYPPECKPKIVESLALTLQHEQPEIRLHAVQELGKIDDPNAVKLIIQALDDADKSVELLAYEQLSQGFENKLKCYTTVEIEEIVQAYRYRLQN